MKSKKKLKLKKNARNFIIFFVIAVFLTVFIIDKYKVYKYHQTNEYKLISLNYTKKEANKIEKELTDKQIKKIIDSEKKDSFVLNVINEKYFLNKNLEKYREYYKTNAERNMSDIIAIVNVGANEDWYYHAGDTDTTKGELMLVNKFHLLKEDFDAGEIVPFEDKYKYGDVSSTKVVHDAFVKMYNAARGDNITIIVTSGFRTYERQDELYKEVRNVNGKIYADGFAARPGASEHETGLALDIFTYQATTENFETTKEYQWLDAHAHEYGFILRYPNEKKYLTGYNPESWHFRYVGVETAKKIKSLGITFDEYYAYYLDK